MPQHVFTGFDSAWSPNNEGAIVSAIDDNGQWSLVGPVVADFGAAWEHVKQVDKDAASHVLAIDQPLIVKNGDGQRPVEDVANRFLTRRQGAASPANRGEHTRSSAQSKKMMFGDGAPIWRFLERLGDRGIRDLHAVDRTARNGRFFFEVFPAMGNLGLFQDLFSPYKKGKTKPVPKYNPDNKKGNFSLTDWRDLCGRVSYCLSTYIGVNDPWLAKAAANPAPRKSDQDQLDSLICLCFALHWTKGGDFCVIGDFDKGYMLTPTHTAMSAELRLLAQKRGVPFWP